MLVLHLQVYIKMQVGKAGYMVFELLAPQGILQMEYTFLLQHEHSLAYTNIVAILDNITGILVSFLRM